MLWSGVKAHLLVPPSDARILRLREDSCFHVLSPLLNYLTPIVRDEETRLLRVAQLRQW